MKFDYDTSNFRLLWDSENNIIDNIGMNAIKYVQTKNELK